MTKLFDGNVSTQSFFQANLSYTKNRAETSNAFAGLVNWNYGLHYQFRINEHLKFLAGGMGELNGGLSTIYVTRTIQLLPKLTLTWQHRA